MELSVIVVNWNVRERLRRCLAAAFAQTGVSFEVFVVDNASADGSVAMVLKEFPEAQVIANNRNMGFAAANNAALAQTKGDFVLLLNPDAEPEAGAFAAMVAYMRSHGAVGVMGPHIVGDDGKTQDSVRRFPTVWSQALIMLKLHHMFRGATILKRYFADGFDYGKESAVDQVIGAAFLVRRSVFETIGPLDARFFIWFEEVDFCKRAIQAGFEVKYAPVATVRHAGGESFAKAFSTVKQRYFNDSLRWYMRKHHGVLAWAVVTVLDPISMLLAWSVQALRVTRKGYDYKKV